MASRGETCSIMEVSRYLSWVDGNPMKHMDGQKCIGMEGKQIWKLGDNAKGIT